MPIKPHGRTLKAKIASFSLDCGAKYGNEFSTTSARTRSGRQRETERQRGSRCYG